MNEHEISSNNLSVSSVKKDENEKIVIQELIKSNKDLKKQIEECEETIHQLQKTIYSLEKQLYKKTIKKQDNSQFIQELFYLCLQHPIKSSPSHQDMKIYIQQTFNQLINSNHDPSYQDCLDILEQYQSLFDIKCYKQIPISLTNLYNKYGELKNFIHSISSIIEVENEDQELVIKTLEKIVEDSKTDEMNKFKKLTKVKDMNEAMRKLCSYDNFVPYYHQLIEQIINLLGVTNEDQIIPTIKTLKMLAHTDLE